VDALTPERWRQIEALFSELADAPPAARTARLDGVAASDPDLAATVAGMLDHATGGSRLQQVIDAVAGTLDAGDTTLPPHFGPYRVVRELGRGGMGVVYEGVSDDEYARRVAIKVAPLARIGARADARFRLERQILSSLDHPHIARFLDGGAEGTLPYFVMEFVQGEPITTYVAARSLPLAERLRIVQTLCGALQYAHQRLVVHRDQKPANILVTADGTPKLLDFGVAKLLDHGDVAMPTISVTAWTPDYASPEQVTGEFVGTPSDIYALGLVLYEVLTGERAQRTDTSSPLALSQSVCETEPARPSVRVAAADRVLSRRLRGDLDTIVMTAIQKDPGRRYASAAALADDIERYLQGLPVEARAGSLWYRTKKALVRHRGVAAAAAIVTVAVLAGLASTAYQARRADRRFQQVRALANEFVFGVHDRIQTLPGSTEARRALVQTALTYLENLREDAGADPGLAKELAAAYQKIGLVQGNPLAANLGEPEAAAASYARARDLLSPLEAGGDAEARLALARVELQLANLRRAQGDVAASEAGFERARALADRGRAARPADAAAVELVGEINADLARSATDRRDPAAAAIAAERALEAADALLALDPADTSRLNNLATALNAVGSARLAQGQLVEAGAHFERATGIRERLAAAAPDDFELQRGLVVALGNLGDLLGGRSGDNLDDYDGAARAYARAVAISRPIAAADANDRRAAFDLVNGLLRLGAALGDTPGRVAEALPFLEEADRINSRLIRAEPGSVRYRYLQVVLDRRLGSLYRLDQRPADAEQRLLTARREAETLFDGPTGLNARQQRALAGVELATLWADRRDRRARPMAEDTRADVSGSKMSPLLEAPAHAALGRAFLTLAGRDDGVSGRIDAEVRDAMITAARAELDACTRVWEGAALPAALHARRDRALAEVNRNRAAVAALSARVAAPTAANAPEGQGRR